MNDQIKDATFISLWNGEDEIETQCKVNMDTKEVFDITMSNYSPDGVCDGEYVEIDDERYPVFQKDEANEGEYWYD